MRNKKSFVPQILLLGFLTFISGYICAQTPKPPQRFALTKENRSLPFKEGVTVIAEVSFTGLDVTEELSEYYYKLGQLPLYEEDLRETMRRERLVIAPVAKFESGKIEKSLIFIKKWLSSKGYLSAEVKALGEKLPKDQMKLIFAIDRGERIRVSEIHFAGNVNATEAELLESFRSCIKEAWVNFNRAHYEYCSNKNTRELLFSKGFLKAKVKSITRKFVSGSYVVTINIEEGIRYRWGEIAFKGNTVFTEKQLLEMFGQRTGEVANAKTAWVFLFEKLKKEYGNRGYILYDAEFDPEFIEPQAEGLDGTVNCKAIIDEGQVFITSKITLSGTDEQAEKRLKEIMPLKEGEIFDQSKLEDGVKKINETGEFYPIDIDRVIQIPVEEQSEMQAPETNVRPSSKERENKDDRAGKKTGRVSIFISLTKIVE